MALNVYTDKSLVKGSIIYQNDLYFNGSTYLSNKGLCPLVLSEIDSATYASSTLFYSRQGVEYGSRDKRMLSTGTKTLLNIINHPLECFSLKECGSNALDFLHNIDEGNALWDDGLVFYAGDDACNINVISMKGTEHYDQFIDFAEAVVKYR